MANQQEISLGGERRAGLRILLYFALAGMIKRKEKGRERVNLTMKGRRGDEGEAGNAMDAKG